MPAGYETPVGEGGGALSGGQKQRLAIARALIGSPKLIVLDEPTSAVDGRTEKLIRQTLSELRGHVTVVIISHRIETTAQCDLLLVLVEREDRGLRRAGRGPGRIGLPEHRVEPAPGRRGPSVEGLVVRR